VCEDKVGGTPFAKSKTAQFVRWNNRDFIKTISRIIGANLDASNYRIEGEYISSENALLFDLNNYTALERKDATDSSDGE
jgi:hypothetical protein